MEEKKFVFLVRTENGVEAVHKAPKGLEISSDEHRWVFKRHPDQSPLIFDIGSSSDLLYSDGWTGPIGVYDLSDPRHVEAFLDQALFHHNEIMSRKLQCDLARIFGEDAMVAQGHQLKTPMEQRRQRLTVLQERFLSCLATIHGFVTGFKEKKLARPAA